MHYQSLLSWERGLKIGTEVGTDQYFAVAPLVGAWIEKAPTKVLPSPISVAPLVGAWIEIQQH